MRHNLTLLPLMVCLSGCVAGIAPIVGVPLRDSKEPMEEVCRTTDSSARVAILCQTTLHEYKLFFSPEGPRDSYPLKRTHHYFVQIGDASPRELTSLSSRHSLDIDRIETIKSGIQWIVIGAGRDPITAARLRTNTAIVFTPEKVIHRFTFELASGAPSPQISPDRGHLRYLSPTGWQLIEL